MRRHLVLIAAVLALAGPALAAPSCPEPERRQFDFWVGAWDVYAKAQPGKLIAHSLIENLYQGCAIRENWMPLDGNSGGSLSAYAPEMKSWKQFWADSQGSSAAFSGSVSGKAMVLTGPWPQPGHPRQITRMTYTPLPDGSVEQLGVTSDDGGKSWQPSFDFLYRRSKGG